MAELGTIDDVIFESCPSPTAMQL